MVQTVGQPVSPELYRSLAGREQVLEGLAVEMGKDIGRLFYEYEARDLGGRLGERPNS